MLKSLFQPYLQFLAFSYLSWAFLIVVYFRNATIEMVNSVGFFFSRYDQFHIRYFQLFS